VGFLLIGASWETVRGSEVIEESGTALASLGTTCADERGCRAWNTLSAVSANVVDNAVGLGEGTELTGGACDTATRLAGGAPAMARSLVKGENGGLEELLVTDIAFIGEVVLVPAVVIVHGILASLSDSTDVANKVPGRIAFVYIGH
jgi:hypothetical protein